MLCHTFWQMLNKVAIFKNLPSLEQGVGLHPLDADGVPLYFF